MSAKVLLLTGASGGIGGAIARGAAAGGLRLVLGFHQNAAGAQKILAEVRKIGAEAITVQADIRDKTGCTFLVEKALRHFGRVDILVNNAGFLRQQPFLNIPEEEWDMTLDINLKAPFLLSQAVFPHMTANGGGHIVNIASSGGQLGGPLAPHYAASKAGLICLTKSLARLGAPHNIIAHTVSPGLIATEMSARELASETGREKLKNIPLGRAGTVTDVAETVLFAVSGKMDYATGQTLNLNGGLYMG
jgi:NAD(P)-dependent dehydrogenase (short-subunit alcohol dehydrogenase family)